MNATTIFEKSRAVGQWKIASAALVVSGVVLGCSSSTSGGTSANCTGSQVPLTVMNFENWCTFEVNGASTSSNAEATVCVAPGTVDLTATANSGFMLGSAPWHDTTTQNGGSATVKVSAAKCVWVCCPGTGGMPACPTSDQCP